MRIWADTTKTDQIEDCISGLTNKHHNLPFNLNKFIIPNKDFLLLIEASEVSEEARGVLEEACKVLGEACQVLEEACQVLEGANLLEIYLAYSRRLGD